VPLHNIVHGYEHNRVGYVDRQFFQHLVREGFSIKWYVSFADYEFRPRDAVSIALVL